ncbi:MAG: flagellar basal body-associated FliL family protein [Parvularculaceae bacterium]|nr:flagellar basal body-associated FliL family protein [Parvularculaceae bacterium]
MSAKDNLENDKSQDAPVKSKPPILLIGLAIVLCAAAGAGGYFISPSFFPKADAKTAGVETPEGAYAEEAADVGDKTNQTKHAEKADSHGAKTTEAHGGGHDSGQGAAAEEDDRTFVIAGDRAYFTPAPLIVSVKPNGRIRHLKISIAVETAPDGEAAFRNNALRIKDVLTTYLTAIDPMVLEQAGAIERIRAQLHKRISLVVAPARVDAVLITDFILS